MRYDFRIVKRKEAATIEALFNTLYHKPQGIEYWDWLFDAPEGYIACGIYDHKKLIGYYSAIMEGDHGVPRSAMIHPDYRKQGLFQLIATFVYNECEKQGAEYIYLFDNENIHHIHINHCGLIADRQIKEYRLPYNPKMVNQFSEYYPLYHTDFTRWRYAQHPLHQGEFDRYIYYSSLDGEKWMVFSTFEGRVQILDFTDLEEALGMGMFIAFLLGKKEVAFWCEQELEYPYVLLPTYRMYKLIGKDINLFKVRKNSILRMYQSDVF